jgi:hypothetical protein
MVIRVQRLRRSQRPVKNNTRVQKERTAADPIPFGSATV